MKIYAHIQDGVVRELIALDDKLVPGKDIFTSDFAANMVDITVLSPAPAQEWTYDGKTFAPPVEIKSVPAPPTLFTPRAFMALFTSAEQTAIFKARQTSVDVDMFITLAMAGNVDVTNVEVIADINALVLVNLLTADRAKQILAGQDPTS